jgi:antitoxin (DNA-binding transcriptional repressor) of toxin-antitoxin stability system
VAALSKRSLFCKKAPQKTFVTFRRDFETSSGGKFTKVFCFFFSKKKLFPALEVFMTDKTQDPRQVDVRAFRGRLMEYLEEVRQGATLLITSRGAVIAELRPPAVAAVAKVLEPRKPGGLRGRIWMEKDFDNFPDDLLDAMEGKGEEH